MNAPELARARRVAVTGAGAPFHAFLRNAYDLPARDDASGDGLAYIGHEFRTYDFMRVGEATAFYAALNGKRWNAPGLAEDLALAGLAQHYEIRRMKRAYRRALVLAYALATSPEILVVERGEEFDEAPAAALLERGVARSARAIVTFGGEADAALPSLADSTAFDVKVAAEAYEAFAIATPQALRLTGETLTRS